MKGPFSAVFDRKHYGPGFFRAHEIEDPDNIDSVADDYCVADADDRKPVHRVPEARHHVPEVRARHAVLDESAHHHAVESGLFLAAGIDRQIDCCR